MKKLIVVINGRGGVGKDTLCDVVGQRFKTFNVSSITPIKEVAWELGWDNIKDEKGRKFLSDLKAITMQYNPDFFIDYLIEKVKSFYLSDDEVMFVHIREIDQINKFELAVQKLGTLNNEVTVKDLLVRRAAIDINPYGNISDDNVFNYQYDYCYDNDSKFEEVDVVFSGWFDRNLARFIL